MTQPIHPMLERVAWEIAATLGEESNWPEYVTQARAAVQALLEPDTDDPAYLNGEYSHRNIKAYLRPLLEVPDAS